MDRADYRRMAQEDHLPFSVRTTAVSVASSTPGPFDLDFPLFGVNDLLVLVNGIEVTNYTLSATFSAGRSDDASITFLSNLSAGDNLKIIGHTDPKRVRNIAPGSPGLVEQIDASQTSAFAILQENTRDLRRGIRFAGDDDEIPPMGPIPEGQTLVRTATGFGAGPTVSEVANAQSHAVSAGQSAAQATAAMQEVQTLYFARYDDLKSSPVVYAEGLVLFIRDTGTSFRVAASDAVDHHRVTDAGVKLYDLTPVHRAEKLRQRPVMLFNTGYTGDGASGELFPGASGAPQGYAVADLQGVKTAFLMQHTVYDSYKVSERQTIVAAPFRLDGQDPSNASKIFSNQLAIGHQSLSAVSNSDGTVTLYAGQTTEAGHEDDDTGKGFSRINWRGALTDQTDVTSYQLFGYQGSGHRFEAYHTSTIGVDPEGRYVVLVARRDGQTRRRLFIYDLAEVVAAADPLTVSPIVSEMLIDTPRSAYGDALQAVAAGPNQIALLYGYTPARDAKSIVYFDYAGRQGKTMEIDGARGLYSDEDLLSHASLGVPYANEAEGMTWDGSGRLLALFYDVWRHAGDVVTYQGINFACVTTSSTGYPPGRGNNHWVRTDLVAGGAYDPAATYTRGSSYTQKNNLVIAIEAPLAAGGDLPLLAGNANKQSDAAFHTGDDALDITVPAGRSFTVQEYNEETGQYRVRLVHNGNRFSVYGSGDDEDQGRFVSVKMNTSGDYDRAEFRLNGSSDNGGALTLTGPNDVSNPNSFFVTARRASDNSTQTLINYNSANDELILRPNSKSISAIRARDANGGGNASATIPTGEITELGGMVDVDLRFESFDTAGMASSNNLFICTLPFTPASERVLGDASLSGVDFLTGEIEAMWVVNTSGNVFLRMIKDNGVHPIANVSQFDGATFEVAGNFRKSP